MCGGGFWGWVKRRGGAFVVFGWHETAQRREHRLRHSSSQHAQSHSAEVECHRQGHHWAEYLALCRLQLKRDHVCRHHHLGRGHSSDLQNHRAGKKEDRCQTSHHWFQRFEKISSTIVG